MIFLSDSHKDRSESRKHNSKIKISEKKSKPSSKKEEKSKGKPGYYIIMIFFFFCVTLHIKLIVAHQVQLCISNINPDSIRLELQSSYYCIFVMLSKLLVFLIIYIRVWL